MHQHVTMFFVYVLQIESNFCVADHVLLLLLLSPVPLQPVQSVPMERMLFYHASIGKVDSVQVREYLLRC